MSIPTGADYHILKAKSTINDVQSYWTEGLRDYGHKIEKLADAMEEIIKALELIRQEQERKDQK